MNETSNNSAAATPARQWKGTEGYYGTVPIVVLAEPDAKNRVPVYSEVENQHFLPRVGTITLAPNPSSSIMRNLRTRTKPQSEAAPQVAA